jgi:hypothetical protein
MHSNRIPFTGTSVGPRYQRDDTPAILSVIEPSVRTNDAKATAPTSLHQDINHGTTVDPTQDSPDETKNEQPAPEEND